MSLMAASYHHLHVCGMMLGMNKTTLKRMEAVIALYKRSMVMAQKKMAEIEALVAQIKWDEKKTKSKRRR